MRVRNAFFILVFALVVPAVGAGADLCPYVFGKTAIGLTKLELALGRHVTIVEGEMGLNIMDGSNLVGDTTFVVHQGELMIMGTEIVPSYRRLGASEALLEAILQKHPGVVTINTQFLTGDNRKVIWQGLSAGLDDRAALMRTPAYRIRAKFGFTEIVSIAPDGGSFRVRRPAPTRR